MLMSWNTREQCWTLTFMDHDENVLVAGIKIVLDAELLRDFPDRNLPAGALVAISDDESKIRIGRHDLGVDVSLIYASEEEVDAII
ncbi:MAG: hypothetical protein KAU20_07645 [Nanoarchaeota archaeon]|nr:hypothetical protein [Nanoarchaeota archaeon]